MNDIIDVFYSSDQQLYLLSYSRFFTRLDLFPFDLIRSFRMRDITQTESRKALPVSSI